MFFLATDCKYIAKNINPRHNMSLDEFFEPLIKCCVTCGEQTHLPWDATEEQKKTFTEWKCKCKIKAMECFLKNLYDKEEKHENK